MKLLFIRHGDPDYSIDSLTEEGWQEASLLAQRLSETDVAQYYCSPLGRAKDTASLTLKRNGRTAIEKEWLREFYSPIVKPYPSEKVNYCWDWIPDEWMKIPELMDANAWKNVPCMKEGKIGKEYDRVCQQFDALMAEYGYEYDGSVYKAKQSNHKTLVFFCHFGVTIVLASHLLHLSPMPLWQGMISAPTGVTTFASEERIKGRVVFRMLAYGDTSHLYNRKEPSFAGRFQECYGDETSGKE